jgi:hypothetical protein
MHRSDYKSALRSRHDRTNSVSHCSEQDVRTAVSGESQSSPGTAITVFTAFLCSGQDIDYVGGDHAFREKSRKWFCWSESMKSEKTELWTLHGRSLCLTEGKVEHSLSPYFANTSKTTSGYRSACPRLWELIGEPNGQIIWCYTCGCRLPSPNAGKMLWALEVPRDQIICRIDDFVWNKIIDQYCSVLDRCWSGCDTLKQGCEKVLRDCNQRKPKTGDWWDELIIRREESGYFRSALIRHPIDPDWVSGKI